MSLDLSSKVVLITGGGRGIGAAAADAFCQAKAKVLIMSRSEDQLNSVAEKCRKKYGDQTQIDVYVGDVSDPNSVKGAYQKNREKWGHVNILLNNAATIAVEKIDEITLESWNRTIAVNVTGAFMMAQAAFASIKESGKPGSIINLSSLGGISGTDKFPGFSAYCVSKFAIVGLTESLAVEGRDIGVRVNCIAPGAVDTKMLNDAAPFLKTETKPEDIAKIIMFLADDDNSGSLTGTTIPVHSNLPN